MPDHRSAPRAVPAVSPRSLAFLLGRAIDPTALDLVGPRRPITSPGNRVIAILDVAADLPYIRCLDCELGFPEPAAIGGPGGEVFNCRELAGGTRPATADDLIHAGWNAADFLPTDLIRQLDLSKSKYAG